MYLYIYMYWSWRNTYCTIYMYSICPPLVLNPMYEPVLALRRLSRGLIDGDTMQMQAYAVRKVEYVHTVETRVYLSI